ncbi:MAG TPA: UrcA family protein [Allosphingosinicella sp.]|nr:UrcA family protein [Allosphingosinicella sp.]
MITKTIRTALAIAVAAAAATGAAAQSRDVTILARTAPADVLVEYVRYGDLNLASASGQARLEDRVRNAVDAVCPAGFAIDLNAAAQSNSCKVAAFTDARSQMDAVIAQARSGQLALAGGGIRVAALR